MSDAPAVVVDDLRKSFDDLVAVDGVTFDVAAGESFGFLGPNGAGKSTTIKILCTLAPPTGGSASVAGFDVVEPSRRRPPAHRPRLPGPDARRLPHRRGEPPVPRGAVRRPARDHRGPAARRPRDGRALGPSQEHRRDLLRRDEAAARDRPRAAALAARAVPRRADRGARPADPRALSGATSRSSGSGRTITIFLTTHYMDEAEHCDRIAIIDHGHDRRDRLARGAEGERGRRPCRAPDCRRRTWRLPQLRDAFGLEPTTSEGAVRFYVANGDRFIPRLFAELTVPILSVSASRSPTLDDVFMSYTGRTIRDAEATASERMAANPFIRRRTGVRR